MFAYVFRNTALGLFHSPDLTDMRRALAGEDDDGPDGGIGDRIGADDVRSTPSARGDAPR